MRFKALPVTSLEDVTLDLEQLSARTILDKTPNNFLQLLSTQRLRLALGTAQTTVAVAAGGNANQQNIAHGLGASPVFSGGFGVGWAGSISNYATADGTNLFLNTAAAAGQTIPVGDFFYWFAIG